MMRFPPLRIMPAPLVKVIVDENYVKEHLSDEFDGEDLEKFIL